MPARPATTAKRLKPAHVLRSGTAEEGRPLGEALVYVGDCRASLPAAKELWSKHAEPGLLAGTASAERGALVERALAEGWGCVDLVFADPPFNWGRAYDRWDDRMDEGEYMDLTRSWLDLCAASLRPSGAMWVNIPDDWAAEIVVHCKSRGMKLINWCVWHYRFGQNNKTRFINSKVHALYFAWNERVRDESFPDGRCWNLTSVLEQSDRAAIYGDKRTFAKKDGVEEGKRVAMDTWYGRGWEGVPDDVVDLWRGMNAGELRDVWYGKYLGRVQGNNKERRHYHDNQLPEVYLRRVIKACSNRGDLVVDPFLGSGTTGVMARALGRRFVGCEFSGENARFAVERMERGPVRPLDEEEGTSTAIFEKRRKDV